MKPRLVVVLIAAAAMVGLSHPVAAHHSQSMFDLRNLTDMTGVVTEFEWTNPHVVIHLDVKNAKGEVEKWLISSTAPNMLQRIGWNRNTLKAGDRVTVTAATDTHFVILMYLRKIVMPNGESVNVNLGN